MKKALQVVLMGFQSLMLPASVYSEPFAPAVEIPDSRYKEFFPDMPKDMAEMLGQWPIVNRDKVPDSSEVPAPAYPGAVVVGLQGRARVGRAEYKGLASLVMVSTDAFGKVRDFYAEKLKGWKQGSYSNGMSIYWAKAGKVEVNSKLMKEPHVRVADFSVLFDHGKRQKKLLPGARTLIEVFYMPAR